MIGLGAGPLPGGFLYERAGFKASFLVAAGLLLIGALLVQLWVDEVPSNVAREREKPFRVFDRVLLTPAFWASRPRPSSWPRHPR
ncbi:MAG: hypothetical protein PVH00_14685 [Gemmatimonadota bacterium]|jgi:hypothetical protein